MLEWILIVTIVTSNLVETESAYHNDLGYELVAQDTIEPELAKSWGAPGVSGNRYLLMRPASKAQVYLRFVESNAAGHVNPHTTEGWNAAELLVADPDELAEQLAGSKHFRIAHPPDYLTPDQNIKAMQVVGPNNEMLYLTKAVNPENTEFDIGSAESFVDRVFIMIAGSRNHRQLIDFYRNRMMLPATEPLQYRIPVLSNAYNLPEDQLHYLSVVTMPNQFFLELDDYPRETSPRQVNLGELPPGIAMVTFEVESLEGITVPFITNPTVQGAMPYNGRRTATLRGAAGELIELVESGPE